jgi:hypothetical protein
MSDDTLSNEDASIGAAILSADETNRLSVEPRVVEEPNPFDSKGGAIVNTAQMSSKDQFLSRSAEVKKYLDEEKKGMSFDYDKLLNDATCSNESVVDEMLTNSTLLPLPRKKSLTYDSPKDPPKLSFYYILYKHWKLKSYKLQTQLDQLSKAVNHVSDSVSSRDVEMEVLRGEVSKAMEETTAVTVRHTIKYYSPIY